MLAPGLLLYVGHGAAAEEHAHASIQIVHAFDGTLQLRLSGRPRWTGCSAIVPANAGHAFDGSGAVIALLLIERHGPRGSWLDERARTLLGVDLAASLAPLAPPALERGTAGAIAWCDGLLEKLGWCAGAHHDGELSEPVLRAMAFLERSPGALVRLPEAATFAGISPTRLTHRFSAEVGLPFRRFALWRRIQRAAEEVREGRSLSEAAIAAGFADAAHFSRTFKEMFGLSPSLVLPALEISGSP